MYKFKQSSAGYPYFYPLGTNSQYYEKSSDEAGNIQAVDPARRMQWMAASWKLFKVTDEYKTATGSNKQILIPSLVLASKCHLN